MGIFLFTCLIMDSDARTLWAASGGGQEFETTEAGVSFYSLSCLMKDQIQPVDGAKSCSVYLPCSLPTAVTQK